MNFILHMHFCFVVEFCSPELNWRRTFLKSWSQIDILGDDASIQQADHTFVYVLFGYWRWILQIFLFFEILLVSMVSEIPCSHHAAKRLLGLIWSIFILVGGSGSQDPSSFGLESVINANDVTIVIRLLMQRKQRLFLGSILYRWQSKIWKILMCLAKILRHRVDQHFILRLQASKCLFQLKLQVLQMLRNLT